VLKLAHRPKNPARFFEWLGKICEVKAFFDGKIRASAAPDGAFDWRQKSFKL
jgi:hypothetical protein